MSGSGGMITGQFWRPDRQTRAAISRGNRLYREYLARKRQEYERALIERMATHQGFEEAR